jgi:hypothetical protein
MLRELLGLPPLKEEGDLLRAKSEIRHFVDALWQTGKGGQAASGEDRRPHYAIWSLGFLDALDELEESVCCASQLAHGVRSAYVEDMDAEERTQYRRYVYFYKNGLIRIFSLLDKLGYFLNEWFGLETEKVKERFSYFTVLRNMHERGSHPALQQRLYELKTAYKEPVSELRKQRNMEIHYVNADMLDDWNRMTYVPDGKLHVENAAEQAGMLQKGYEMALLALLSVFRYLNERREADGA